MGRFTKPPRWHSAISCEQAPRLPIGQKKGGVRLCQFSDGHDWIRTSDVEGVSRITGCRTYYRRQQQAMVTARHSPRHPARHSTRRTARHTRGGGTLLSYSDYIDSSIDTRNRQSNSTWQFVTHTLTQPSLCYSPASGISSWRVIWWGRYL
jgi:hypothetical protein